MSGLGQHGCHRARDMEAVLEAPTIVGMRPLGVDDGQRAPRGAEVGHGGARMARAACRQDCTSRGGVHVARTRGGRTRRGTL